MSEDLMKLKGFDLLDRAGQLLHEVQDLKEQATKSINPMLKAKIAEQAVGKSVAVNFLLLKHGSDLEVRLANLEKLGGMK